MSDDPIEAQRPDPRAVVYRRVHLDGAVARTCAGDAPAGLERCRSGTTAVREEPGIGWCGRVAARTDLMDLATEVASPLAAPLRAGKNPPILTAAASKGDTGLLLPEDCIAAHLPLALPGSLTPRLAARLGLGLYLDSVPIAACSTGLYALLEAADALEHGRARHGLTVAVDASLQPVLLAGYRRLGVLCRQAPQAFTGADTGFAPAEGAAAIGLDAADGPWRLVAGLRLADARHETRCVDGDLLAGTLRALWRVAPLPDCIVAHATGTRAGDAYELSGLDTGPWAEIPRLICKPVIGHCLGASGLVELALALHGPWRRLWKLSFGFGGHIAAVAAERT